MTPYIDSFTVGDCEVFVTTVDTSEKHNRREAERRAVEHLVKFRFGAEARYHHLTSGAPAVEGSGDVYISVSHSRSNAVLAVRRAGPVGVDIECWQERLDYLRGRFLTDREKTCYAGETAELMQYWTAKEATFKAANDPGLVISRIEVDLRSLTAESLVDGRKFRLMFTGSFPLMIAIAWAAEE